MKKIISLLLGLLILSGLYFLTKTDQKNEETLLPTALSKNEKKIKKQKRSFEESKALEETVVETNKEQRIRETKKIKTKKKPKTQEEAIKEMMAQVIDATYKDLFTELNLSPETQKAFQAHLVENQIALQKLMQQLVDPSLSDEDIIRDQKEKRMAQDNSLDKILDLHQQDALNEYQKNLPVKTAQNLLPNLLPKNHKNMSPQGKEAFAKIFVQKSNEYQKTPKVLQQAQNKAFVTAENIKETRDFMGKIKKSLSEGQKTTELIMAESKKEYKKQGYTFE